ncbi:histidinol dehydrogenase [Alkalibacillus filiformis]|uniref:Histidinol dehydrogenase n=1 Tax=Alkalibacillus filiformis TaxID=200990 RepID=A0ABU0DUQ5_9BACI|nr:histidinol dehydrogenase [Alkalibacillus filiformis]MDQ0352189.1 histidinol dehydrogenase [Alkalibacillus filiformis]
MKVEQISREDIEKVVKNRLARNQENNQIIDERVEKIVNNVRNDGDQAVYQYIKQLDGVELDDYKVSQEEIDYSFTQVDESLIQILKEAKENIVNYHQLQKEQSWYTNHQQGVWLGQQVRPIERVGVYVPGGKAAYPSTVLMNILPAKVAGVEQVIATTPVQRDGSVNPTTIVAASMAGADEILKIGGAHGIATLAYGTENVSSVHKIVGPGNAYVARAKKYVFGDVGIDLIAGPSEVCVVADDEANAKFVAADLLAQAEHDELASAVAVTTSEQLADEIKNEVERQKKNLKRQDILQQSIYNEGSIYVVSDLDVAFEFVNELAPEHLELQVRDPFEQLEKVKNAGAIFLGDYSPEPLGDYFAGPNHTLPTSGTAKFSSPLGVYDFMKKSSVIYYNEQALSGVRRQIEQFADEEGLDAHKESVRIRFE